jgi:hypothetical protein
MGLLWIVAVRSQFMSTFSSYECFLTSIHGFAVTLDIVSEEYINIAGAQEFVNTRDYATEA